MGSKSSPPPPDYSAMAAASGHAADVADKLGTAQLAENQRQYNQNMSTLAPVIASDIASQKQQAEQGLQVFNETDPSRRANAATAARFSTDGYGDYLAGQAGADMTSAQAAQDAASERQQQSMGVNPSSGKAMALTGLERVMNAANTAGAMTNARNKAVATGFDMNASVAGQGGIGTTMYSNSTGAGAGASGTQLGIGGANMAGMSAGNGTIMNGQGLAVQGAGNILNAQGQAYSAGLNSNAQQMAGLGSLAGAGLGLGAYAYMHH